MKVVLLLCLFGAALLCEAKPFSIQWSTLAKQPPLALGAIWNNCTKATDQGVIDSVTIDPPAPKKGDDVTVEATFMLKEDVTSGKINVNASLDNVPLYSGSFDLCDVVDQVGLSCPIAAGMHSIKVGPVQIPDIAPTGTYAGAGTITDQNGKEVGCATASYKLE